MGETLPTTQKAANIRSLLERSRGQMEKALPKHLTADRLLRVAMTSIQKTPKLLECTPQSLLACVMTCAQLGLEPDQFLGQAYLVPFKDTRKGILICTLIPGYRGYIALARRSGEVQSVSSQVVYSKDHFVLQYGIEEKLEHIPADGDRGEPKGAYVVFKYKDGSYSFDYMSKGDIEKIRRRSKTPNDGPWVTDWDEMAKKTVIKRHSKLSPLSVEFQKAIALEERANLGESQDDLLGLGDDPNIIDADMTEQKGAEQIAMEFEATVPKGTDQEALTEFLEAAASRNSATVEMVKAEAVQKPAEFWKVFNAYMRTRKKKENGPNPDAPAAGPAVAPAPCPDAPETTFLKSHCDTACQKRQGCPVWA